MSESKPFRPQLNPTRGIPNPSEYIQALEGEFADLAFSEERAQGFRGAWREKVFGATDRERALDVEVGTGNGYFFAHRAKSFPERFLVGLELKFKPLIQSVRRAQREGASNMRMVRYHAMNMDQLFAPQEIHNVFVHFPDPWERPRKFKHRIMNREFLARLHQLQCADSSIEFKTDSREYFLWALNEIKESPYDIEFKTLDLHGPDGAQVENFRTGFENIFLRQGIPINYALLRRRS